jgi:putative ABC transport system permease protein
MNLRGMRGVRWLFRSRAEMADDVDEEIAFHLRMRAESLEREGRTRAEAEAEARREFGEVAGLRSSLLMSDTRVQRRLRWSVVVDELRQDTSFAVRSLRRAPAFAAVALGTLALSLGAAVAMFSVVNAVVLRPLPYDEPGRLVLLSPGQNSNITLAETLESNVRGLAAVSGMSQWGLTLTGAGEAVSLEAQVVEPAFFDVFAVRPSVGRVFREDERDPARSDVVIVSDAIWRARFGADPSIIGRRIDVDGYGHRSREVIGIMPRGFEAPLTASSPEPHLWVPLTLVPGRTIATDSSWYVNTVAARMHAGVGVADIARDVRGTMERLRAEFSQISEDDVRQSGAAGMLDSVVGDARRTLWILLGAVGLVLLLACANLANLLLARGARRRQELAARAALGASRARLVRELVTESVLLAALGATLGLALAGALLQLLRVSEVSGLPRAADLGLDIRVVVFACVATTMCVLLFGVLPALFATAGDLRPSLGPGSRVRGQSRSGRRFGSMLIGGEVALAMVLVTGAGLLISSFRVLRSVDPGMDASDVLAVRLAPASAEYDGERAVQLYNELFERLRRLPGVSDVGAIHLLPFTGGNWRFPYLADGHEPPANAPLPSANFRVVTPSYFDALDIGLVAGRAFDSRDQRNSEPVGIINRRLADQLWPGEQAVGREIRMFGNSPIRVVGVVGDVRQHGLDTTPEPEIYRPISQWTLSSMTVTVESAGSLAALEPMVRAAVRAMDENIPVTEVRPLDSVIHESLARRRFFAAVLTTFGAVAMLLGIIGIYGVMTYNAASRVPEFGVRIALGATHGDVLRLAFAAGLTPVAVGLAGGTAAAMAAGRLISGLLYGIQPHDPATLLVAIIVLGGAASLASWIPARRFSRVDPVSVLGSN